MPVVNSAALHRGLWDALSVDCFLFPSLAISFSFRAFIRAFVCKAILPTIVSCPGGFYLFIFLKKFLFIIYLLCLFLAVLGLHFCVRAFSSCGKWGPLFIAVRGPLTIAASLVAEQRLQTLRLSSCGSRAQLLRRMWDLPRPGLEPVSPALAGRFSTTAPPGKPPRRLLIGLVYIF